MPDGADLTDLIVMPVFNEAATLRQVWQGVRRYSEAPLLAVDDGSQDDSPHILRELQVEDRGLYVLRHARNLGYGKALVDGWNWAQAAGALYVVTMDCDAQHEPSLIPAFFQRLRRENVDVLSGSRYLPDSPRCAEAPGDRRQLNAEMCQVIREITGWQLSDAFCGFKAYRLAAVTGLQLDEPGYGFPLQFWLQAWNAGLKVTEAPVPLIYHPAFERRFGGGLDDWAARRRYYYEVIRRELKRLGVAGKGALAPEGKESEQKHACNG
ncbi:MAG: glycosyltransferase family 2 protein [Firmicutes bacterium]|nr:glycosyltransferase family 2 protein [Bacillota bacterium]